MRIIALTVDPEECKALEELLKQEKIGYRVSIDWENEIPEIEYKFCLELK